MDNLHDNLKTNLAALVNKSYWKPWADVDLRYKRQLYNKLSEQVKNLNWQEADQ